MGVLSQPVPPSLSEENGSDFWLAHARLIDWSVFPSVSSTKREDGWYDWFRGGILNTSFNALDRHLGIRGHQDALVWYGGTSDSMPVHITYDSLSDRVARFAGGLRNLGVVQGDRVLIMMPTMIEAVIAMLATVRIGAIHVFVFDQYSQKELSQRIDDVTPKVVITASCSIRNNVTTANTPLVQAAVTAARHKPSASVVLQRPQMVSRFDDHTDIDFHDLECAEPVPPVDLKSEDPLYILHTSGTTGQPKGVVRDNGGHAVAMIRSMSSVYGLSPGDVFFSTCDLGWVVGHSYGVYGPLLMGATSVLVEGPCDASRISEILRDQRVSVLFTTPTQMRVLRQRQARKSGVGQSTPETLKRVFVAGERTDAELLRWARDEFACPVFDHWWQTETGWSIAGGRADIAHDEVADGYLGYPSEGFNLVILNDQGELARSGEEGDIMLRLPLPPGCISALWNRGDDFQKLYLFGHDYYKTFDRGVMHPTGVFKLLSRSDDVIKSSGRRIACGVIEDVLLEHPEVFECAVVGVSDQIRGSVPVAYVVREPGSSTPDERLVPELVSLVRVAMGSFLGFRHINFVEKLPRTKSGKIIRRGLVSGNI